MDRKRTSLLARLGQVLLVLVVIIAGFLLLAPTDVQPVSWTPPKAPSLTEGVYASNTRLDRIKPVGAPDIPGPESLLIDDDGFLITGLHDGRIVRTNKDGDVLTLLAQTGGRPLGIARHPDGRLIIADAIKGLLALDAQGHLTELTHSSDGVPFGFTDNLSIDRAGRFVYFSDASSRWGYGHDGEAIIEHGGDGRLLRYDFSTGKTDQLLGNLQFANGVALGPDDEYVLVNETGAYRITRYWLKGARAGQHDVFIDNLPGLPDNLSFNGIDHFWVALYAPRSPLLDGLAEHPFIRKMVVRALLILPKPIEHRAFALGLDTQGKVIANLQDDGKNNYSPITEVRENNGWLYFGSLTRSRMAHWPLDAVTAPTLSKTEVPEGQ
jgi:Strictosidine synthase/Adipocyte plasma membrane-associated protein-like, N-terminal